MPDTIPPFLRDLYVARRRACIQEANDIATVLGLDPVRTEAEWRRRCGETSVAVAIVIPDGNEDTGRKLSGPPPAPSAPGPQWKH